MSKRPDSVEIGAFTYTLSWDPNLTQLGAAGMTNQDNLILGIDPSIDDQVQKETLVHELLHAVWKQTHLLATLPDKDEDSPGEAAIQALSPYVYRFIRDNREAVRWLQS